MITLLNLTEEEAVIVADIIARPLMKASTRRCHDKGGWIVEKGNSYDLWSEQSGYCCVIGRDDFFVLVGTYKIKKGKKIVNDYNILLREIDVVRAGLYLLSKGYDLKLENSYV